MNSAVTGLKLMTLVVSFRPTPSILTENGLDTNKNLVSAWKRFLLITLNIAMMLIDCGRCAIHR